MTCPDRDVLYVEDLGNVLHVPSDELRPLLVAALRDGDGEPYVQLEADYQFSATGALALAHALISATLAIADALTAGNEVQR